jgi:hypothetical protein
MPEAKPETARLDAKLVLLLLVELPTLARAPEDIREDRLVPLIELIVLVVLDMFFTPFYLSVFLIFCHINPANPFQGESSDGAPAPSEDSHHLFKSF